MDNREEKKKGRKICWMEPIARLCLADEQRDRALEAAALQRGLNNWHEKIRILHSRSARPLLLRGGDIFDCSTHM